MLEIDSDMRECWIRSIVSLRSNFDSHEQEMKV